MDRPPRCTSSFKTALYVAPAGAGTIPLPVRPAGIEEETDVFTYVETDAATVFLAGIGVAPK